MGRLGTPVRHPLVRETAEEHREAPHRTAILASIEHGLSNGRVESMNTKIRLMTRIAFGFTSPDALIACGFKADAVGGSRHDDRRAGEARDAVGGPVTRHRERYAHARAAIFGGTGCPVKAAIELKPLAMSQMAKKISNSPPGMVEMSPAPATPKSSSTQPVANAA